MSDREDLLNNLTGAEPALEPAEVLDGNTPDPVDTEIDPPADIEPASTEPDNPLGGKETAAFLDSLTGDKPAEAQEVAPPAAPEKPEAEKTLEEQEAEALETVKSERGQERIKATFAKLRETEERAAQHEADIKEFREMVVSTGMAPEEFAQTLEFGRLAKSSNEADKRLALQMVEQQREQLCKELGIEAPGVDVLADFPELKKAVDNMEVTPAYALQLAKVERAKRQEQATQQAQQARQQDMTAYQNQITEVAKVADSYFATKTHEADYPAKMGQLSAKFKDPAFMQEFVATYEPKQWFSVLKMMYDSISVPQAPRQEPQPIRSGARNAGTPASTGAVDLPSSLMSTLDGMGI